MIKQKITLKKYVIKPNCATSNKYTSNKIDIIQNII